MLNVFFFLLMTQLLEVIRILLFVEYQMEPYIAESFFICQAVFSYDHICTEKN